LFTGYVLLLLYYRQAWLGIPLFQAPPTYPSTRITVIVPARNEERFIKDCLDSLCAQSYPKNLFEVLVVDDHSTDRTAQIVDGFDPLLIKRISLKDHVEAPINSYKKKAIEIGVLHSNGDLILTTDADCIVPAGWITTLAAFYETCHPAFIAAPVLISPVPGRFLAIFQSLDFMTLQGITGAAVEKKFHMMCNGANLAYEKKAFNTVGGFSGISDIASGDDMLLMNKIFRLYPNGVKFLKSKNATVQTNAEETVWSFFSQRIRWASKAGVYKDKKTFPVLLLVYLFNLSLVLLLLISFFEHNPRSILDLHFSLFELWLILLALKTIAELFFLYPVAVFFENQKLLWWFPVLQPFHIVYTLVSGCLGSFGKYKWKGRRVR
jgi:cellulose synthase/poly-beta-1,6-N-acetylglucosamine synthase-like glycosyltransferase